MKNYTMTKERNRRLRQEVAREMRSSGCKDARVALARVLRRPLERGFYLGVETVLVMDRRRRSGALPVRGKRRAAMWADLFGQVDCLMASDPGLTRVDAVCKVLATGTSRMGFMLGPERGLRVLGSDF